MNPSPIQAAGQYALRGSVIVFFVALLTFIFSFLGTIICAVVAGMMMGAARPSTGRALPVALIFPAVIFTLLRSLKSELEARQIGILALVCFAAFWLSYLLCALVLYSERRTPAPARGPTLCPPRAGGADEAGDAGTRSLERPAELTLDQLQGRWRRETPADALPMLMEITRDRLVLHTPDATGRLAVVAQGNLRLDGSGPDCTLVLSGPVRPAATGET